MNLRRGMLFGLLLAAVIGMLAVAGRRKPSGAESATPKAGVKPAQTATPLVAKDSLDNCDATTKAVRLECADSIRWMWCLCKRFSEENQGRLPQDMYELRASGLAENTAWLHCPICGSFAPGRPIKRLMEGDYRYFVGGLTLAEVTAPDVVVAADLPANHGDGHINVIFGDGHIVGVMLPKGTDFKTFAAQQGWKILKPPPEPVIVPLAKFSELTLSDQPIPMPGGRLTMKLPEDRPDRHCSVCVSKVGIIELEAAEDARLTIYVIDMRAVSGNDFKGDLLAYLIRKGETSKGLNVKLEKIEVAPPLTAYAIIFPPPYDMDNSNRKYRIMELYVRNTDGTVQYLDCTTNRQGWSDRAGTLALLRKIAATVGPGSSKPKIKARESRLDGPDDDKLVITVPDGVLIELGQFGEPNSVYLLSSLGDYYESSGCIWCDFRLSPYSNDIVFIEDRLTGVRGKLFGKEVEWKTGFSNSRGCFFEEIIIPYPEKEGISIQLYFHSESQDGLRKMQAMMETLRIEKAKK